MSRPRVPVPRPPQAPPSPRAASARGRLPGPAASCAPRARRGRSRAAAAGWRGSRGPSAARRRRCRRPRSRRSSHPRAPGPAISTSRPSSEPRRARGRRPSAGTSRGARGTRGDGGGGLGDLGPGGAGRGHDAPHRVVVAALVALAPGGLEERLQLVEEGIVGHVAPPSRSARPRAPSPWRRSLRIRAGGRSPWRRRCRTSSNSRRSSCWRLVRLTGVSTTISTNMSPRAWPCSSRHALASCRRICLPAWVPAGTATRRRWPSMVGTSTCAAQGRGGHRDRHAAEDVRALAAEQPVRRHADEDVEVARLAAPDRRPRPRRRGGCGCRPRRRPGC